MHVWPGHVLVSVVWARSWDIKMSTMLTVQLHMWHALALQVLDTPHTLSMINILSVNMNIPSIVVKHCTLNFFFVGEGGSIVWYKLLYQYTMLILSIILDHLWLDLPSSAKMQPLITPMPRFISAQLLYGLQLVLTELLSDWLLSLGGYSINSSMWLAKLWEPVAE